MLVTFCQHDTNLDIHGKKELQLNNYLQCGCYGMSVGAFSYFLNGVGKALPNVGSASPIHVVLACVRK